MGQVRWGLRITIGFSKSNVNRVVGAESLVGEGSGEKRNGIENSWRRLLFWGILLQSIKAWGKSCQEKWKQGILLCCLLRRDISMSVYWLRRSSRECKTNDRAKDRISGLTSLLRQAGLGPRANTEGLALEEPGDHLRGRKAEYVGAGRWRSLRSVSVFLVKWEARSSAEREEVMERVGSVK